MLNYDNISLNSDAILSVGVVVVVGVVGCVDKDAP